MERKALVRFDKSPKSPKSPAKSRLSIAKIQSETNSPNAKKK